jgi:hypothetical protein
MKLIRPLAALALAACAAAGHSYSSEPPNAGFLFDQFPLTLDEGVRTEALGPAVYWQSQDSRDTFAVPPLFSHEADDETDFTEFDFLYPVLTYDRFGSEYRLQLFHLLSFSGGANQEELQTKRFTLFPFYFQQRSEDTNRNYTALFPLYGHLEGRLFRSEIDFVLWPAYAKTVRQRGVASAGADLLFPESGLLKPRRDEVTTYNYVYPIFHLRYGEGLKGWQFWPVTGHEHKDVTWRTNSWGDGEMVPGHDKWFWLWPLIFNQTTGVGTENREHRHAFLPFYSALRSPLRDSTSYLWPLGLTLTEDREKHYREVDAPWPLVVFARGEGKYTSRIWPFFSRAHTDSVEKNFYLWPVYKYTRWHTDALDRRRTRLFFFLGSHVTEQNVQTEAVRTRSDLWPLFTHSRRFDGSTRLQLLAPLESILPNNKSVERNYSPLWSLWRSESNPKTKASSQSLLWNLYRREVKGPDKKCSLLFGLFQYQSLGGGKRLRLLYVPLVNTTGLPGADGGASNPSH